MILSVFFWIPHDFIYAEYLLANRNDETCIYLKIRRKKKLQFLGCAHQRMKDAQVGDRELQATTERYKCEPLR